MLLLIYKIVYAQLLNPASINLSMKIILYFFAIVSISYTSCAQAKYGVVKTQAFYREVAPGAMSADDRGNQQNIVDTVYSIFLEIKPIKTTVWKKAWVGSRSYKVLSTIMSTPHIAGMKKDSMEKIIISTQRKNQLLQLNLEKSMAEPIPAKFKTSVSPKAILLQGVQNGKTVYMSIKTMKQVRGQENE